MSSCLLTGRNYFESFEFFSEWGGFSQLRVKLHTYKRSKLDPLPLQVRFSALTIQSFGETSSQVTSLLSCLLNLVVIAICLFEAQSELHFWVTIIKQSILS